VRKSKPAIFLDRDGTLLTERGYLSDPQRIFFYPSAVLALKRLQKGGYRLIVITNQSGVGRGYFSLARLGKINVRFRSLLRARGVAIDGIYFCPHAPDAGCRCRKPKPYLLKRAAARWRIPLASSYVIGDQMTDVGLAVAAGVRPILVLTGLGRANRKKARAHGAKITRDVNTAAAWILANKKTEKVDSALT
jgi:histidinol-phosphate phosphatase family protein